MGLLAPWFLAGASLLGLPVYIHLLQQYRQTPVRFSSLMFFEKRTQSSIKHRRLKYILLFTLRCLFIALLILAFARPYIRSTVVAKATGARTIVFAIDNSFSMRQGDRFAHAKQSALEEISKMGPADRGQIVTFGGPARLVTDMTPDKPTLQAAVTAMEPGDDLSSYAEISRVFRSTAESLKTDIEAQVFTDAQASSLPAAFSDLKVADGTKLVVHPFSDQPIPNWTVETVDAPSRVFDTKKVRTLATVVGFNTPEATKKVSLVAKDKVVESKEVKIPANGRATVEFLTLDVPYGLTKCEIRIEGGDTFPNDDHWFFSVERADPKPALLIHGDNDNNSGLYLRTAMESATDAAFTLDSRTPSTATNLDPAKFAFTILSDPGPLPQKLEEALTKYVEGGGSILISLGRNAPRGRSVAVAGIPVLDLHTIAAENESVQTAAQLDTSYPAIGSGGTAKGWDGVEIFQFAKLQVPDSPEYRVAARLANGLPLLVDKKVGEGHVIVFASAFDNVANNLPIQPVWLPFVEQTTHFMGGVGAGRGTYKVGSFVDLRSTKEKNIPVEVIGPGDKRLLSLSESSKATTFQFPGEGFYSIRRANGREELAAVNADRRESDFATVTRETLDLWKNTGIAPTKASGAAGGTSNTRDDNTELWWWVLALLAALAVAESILGNRHLSAGSKEAA